MIRGLYDKRIIWWQDYYMMKRLYKEETNGRETK